MPLLQPSTRLRHAIHRFTLGLSLATAPALMFAPVDALAVSQTAYHIAAGPWATPSPSSACRRG